MPERYLRSQGIEVPFPIRIVYWGSGEEEQVKPSQAPLAPAVCSCEIGMSVKQNPSQSKEASPLCRDAYS